MSARLFVLGGRDVGRSFAIEEAAVLGRGEECDVKLRDRSVSRAHARVFREEGRWILEDLGSRNGIRLRGERVERAPLADHDEILLGELPLRFRLEDSSLAAEELEAAPAEIVLAEEPAAPSEADERIARSGPRAPARACSRQRTTGSFLGWDLAELPGWQRTLSILFVLAFALGLGWLAFRAIQGFRSSW